MKRRIWLTIGIQATRIIGRVLAGVPSPPTEVDAAGERQAVVDDHDFLMMAGTCRMLRIELEMQASRA